MRKKNGGPKKDIPSVAEAILAKKIAHTYRRKAKARNIHVQPWRLDQPLESLKVFTHLVNTARIVMSIGAEYKDFVRAQFDCWNGPPNRYPLPHQLCTDGALDRYNVWLLKNKPRSKRQSRAVTRRKKNGFMREQKRLDRLCKTSGLESAVVLSEMQEEFSKGFLKHHGAWE